MLPREYFGSDDEFAQVQEWARTLVPRPSYRGVVRVFLVWIGIIVLVFVLWQLFGQTSP